MAFGLLWKKPRQNKFCMSIILIQNIIFFNGVHFKVFQVFLWRMKNKETFTEIDLDPINEKLLTLDHPSYKRCIIECKYFNLRNSRFHFDVLKQYSLKYKSHPQILDSYR